MSPLLSPRGRMMPASPIRKLMPHAVAAKARGVEVLHLNIGQPDLETPAPMRQRIRDLSDHVLAYSPSEGTPEYIDSLLRYYAKQGIALEREQLVATTGGSEAILFSLCAVAEPGDTVMVVEPFYTNYASFIRLAGLELSPVVSRGEDGFHLPGRDAFEAARTERTRALILCNPSNPTGTVYRVEEVRMVAEFCRDHDLFLIGDEVYREFVYDGHQSISVLSLKGFEAHVILVDSLSKRYSACGIRLGNLATRNAAVREACLRMAQGRLSPPGLAQVAALGALELDEHYFTGIRAEYQVRRDVLFEGLTRIPGVFLRKPEGAFYMVVRLPIEDSEHFATWMLTDFTHQGRTVMMAPAAGFYGTPGLGLDEVRLAYVLKEDRLRQAVEILEEGLKAYGSTRGP